MNNYNIALFQRIPTPFYWYKMELLEDTLKALKKASNKYGYHVHYALKANANQKILKMISNYGFGADCVSGNEVLAAIKGGFPSSQIVFAGVGKSDEEINISLESRISCFNCESLPELEVINQLAAQKGMVANMALRINPNVNANTHQYITTGLEENKFGINFWELEEVLLRLKELPNIKLIGLHFHIGSQITDLSVFKGLCLRVNEIQQWFYAHKIIVDHINVGGGLGIDYDMPDEIPVPDFQSFFKVFHELLELRPKQSLHFELGRSVVANCADLISRVLYVKKGVKTQFAILDAGMTELIRPALYQAYHKIQNITSKEATEKYDVVGPICESADSFGKAVELPGTKRGDLIAIRCTGAYGEVMVSKYNLRDKVKAYYSDEF